jgi:hypothetical protein
MAVATGADRHLSVEKDGGLCGTPGYMPPELGKSDQGWYDPTLWDVFSMAMVRTRVLSMQLASGC